MPRGRSVQNHWRRENRGQGMHIKKKDQLPGSTNTEGAEEEDGPTKLIAPPTSWAYCPGLSKGGTIEIVGGEHEKLMQSPT